MAGHGVGFDWPAWERLAGEAEARATASRAALDTAAPPRPEGEAGAHAKSERKGTGAVWNWNSPAQVRAALACAGAAVESTGDEVLAGLDHPLAGALRDYREAAQLVKMYGRHWAGFVEEAGEGGRIYAGWHQLGTATGRSSGSSPNLQQVPKTAVYRRCFAAPPRRLLVACDFAQVQLRAVAKLSNDRGMLEALRRGEDLHTLTARAVTGKAKVGAGERKLAKALNFGLCFGMGAERFRGYARKDFGIRLTDLQAAEYRDAFFRTWPGLALWHRKEALRQQRVKEGREAPGESRTALGRRRLFTDKTRLTDRLNTPAQGLEADGAKRALAYLWERRDECPGAYPVLFTHDEIVVECAADQAGAVGAWLKRAMTDAMAPLLAPVPVGEIEVKVAPTWGGGLPGRERRLAESPADNQLSPVTEE
jgi:DNA polymerase-1